MKTLFFLLIFSMSAQAENHNLFLNSRNVLLNSSGKIVAIEGQTSNWMNGGYVIDESNSAKGLISNKDKNYRLEVYKNNNQVARVVEVNKRTVSTAAFDKNKMLSYTKCYEQSEKVLWLIPQKKLSCVTISPSICSEIRKQSKLLEKMREKSKECKDLLEVSNRIKAGLQKNQLILEKEKLANQDQSFIEDCYDHALARPWYKEKVSKIKQKDISAPSVMALPENVFGIVETLETMTQMCDTADDFASGWAGTTEPGQKAIK